MIHCPWAVWQSAYILLLPPLAKLWASLFQGVNEFVKTRIAGITHVIGTKACYEASCLLLPVHVKCTLPSHKKAPYRIE